MMNETLKLKLKRSDSGEDSGEWSCESPESSSLERLGGKEFIENTRSKRKLTENIKSSKNRKGVIAGIKRIRKCVLQLKKSVSEFAQKENQVENFPGRNLISDETSGKLSATDDQDSCNEIASDLKARLIDETSMENLTEKETGSVSAINKKFLEYKIACGIEDISDDSTDSYSISDLSFKGTSREDVKNAHYGECTTAGISSSPVCVQAGNSKNPNLNVSNLEASTHGYKHYGSGAFAINCGKNLGSDCNLNIQNLGLIREQEHDESKRELSGERVLQGFSDKRDHKPASPLEVSNFTTQMNNLSTKMTNIDKYVDGASSNSTSTSFGKYLSPSYNAIKMSDHNKEGSTNLIQMPSVETLLPPSNPYMAMLDSKGTPIANPYNVTGTIIKPIPTKYKENEAVNFSWPNGSPGTSAPSISVKRPVESKRKEQNKRFKCYICKYVTNSDSEFHMHQMMHTYPVGGLQMNNQINAFQNPGNVNALYWRSNECVNLGGNPRFRHPFYSPMYRLPEMPMLGANSYFIPASGQNCLADSGARNPPVDLARLQSTGAQSYEGTKSTLRAPVVDISSEKVFSCCVCRNFSTDSLEDITEHVLKDRSQHDDSISNDGEVSTCTVCNFKTRSQQTMVVHSKSNQHQMKVDHSNHIKEGGSKSYQYTLAHPEIPGTVYVHCSVCSYYAESFPDFQKHTTLINHINNVKFKKFLESFETEREYYICKSCDKTLRSRNDLFVHSTSNEHRAAEYRLLTAHGDRNLGGIYITKETRSVEWEPKENVEANTITSTSAKVESKKKKRNYSRRSLHQNEARESTKEVSDNNAKVKKIGSQEIDSSLSVEGKGTYCSLCPARFSKASDCLIHFKEVHGAGNYSALTYLNEMVADKQVTGTFKGTNSVTDVNQNTRTNACAPKRNEVLSELNSNTDDSERSIGFRKPTKTNSDNITNRTDEGLTDQSLYLRNKTNALESENVNFIPSTFSQNNGECSLSTRDIESNNDCNSESSEIDVG